MPTYFYKNGEYREESPNPSDKVILVRIEPKNFDKSRLASIGETMNNPNKNNELEALKERINKALKEIVDAVKLILEGKETMQIKTAGEVRYKLPTEFTYESSERRLIEEGKKLWDSIE